MPDLKRLRGPLIPCAYIYCTNNFHQWRRRKFCSTPCRKRAWRVEHQPYYAEQQRLKREREKAEHRDSLRWRWSVDGEEDSAPERLTLAEAIANASPSVIEQVKELLGDEVE